MASDERENLAAYFREGVFTSSCPGCNDSHDFVPSEFTSRTIPYTCKCGREFTILPIGLRGSYRKAVKLPASLAVNPKNSKVQVPCVVRDISTNGIGLLTHLHDTTTTITMQLNVKLDDTQKTPLVLPCKVRRKKKEGNDLLLGLEFKRLDPDSKKIIEAYLSRERST